MDLDVNFLAGSFSALCGMPVRIYKGEKLNETFSLIDFKHDPIEIDIDEILKRKESIGYYIDEYFYYYGYINFGDSMLVVGPSREVKIDNYNLGIITSKLKIENVDEIKDFENKMSMLVPMPLSSLIQSLISLNYVLNNEKKTIDEIIVGEKPKVYDIFKDEKIDDIHNSFVIENKIFEMIKNGDIESFNNFKKEAQSVRRGNYTTDYLRNLKDNFISAITLISRKAIEASLDINESLNMERLYINKLELLNNPNDIQQLEYKMVYDYISKVNQIKSSNKLVTEINKYIIKNLSRHITVEDLTKITFLSRGTLFQKVKEQTGKTVNDYVNSYKIKHSKKLIEEGMSFSNIAFMLGYSSQQHYSLMFKKVTGITPSKYKASL